MGRASGEVAVGAAVLRNQVKEDDVADVAVVSRNKVGEAEVVAGAVCLKYGVSGGRCSGRVRDPAVRGVEG